MPKAEFIFTELYAEIPKKYKKARRDNSWIFEETSNLVDNCVSLQNSPALDQTTIWWLNRCIRAIFGVDRKRGADM